MEQRALDRLAQAAAVRLAREAMAAAVHDRPGPSREAIAEAEGRYPALREPAGAFVTIYVDEVLRGCLGEIEPTDSLAHVIARCAARVPRYDYRFPPVRPEEWARLTFKISVLSPLEPVASLDEIRVGTHGLVVRHEGRGGLLLPEVPVEHGWDLTEFLRNLWRKAGIPPTVPVNDVKLWRFTTQVIAGKAVPDEDKPS